MPTFEKHCHLRCLLYECESYFLTLFSSEFQMNSIYNRCRYSKAHISWPFYVLFWVEVIKMQMDKDGGWGCSRLRLLVDSHFSIPMALFGSSNAHCPGRRSVDWPLCSFRGRMMNWQKMAGIHRLESPWPLSKCWPSAIQRKMATIDIVIIGISPPFHCISTPLLPLSFSVETDFTISTSCSVFTGFFFGKCFVMSSFNDRCEFEPDWHLLC